MILFSSAFQLADLLYPPPLPPSNMATICKQYYPHQAPRVPLHPVDIKGQDFGSSVPYVGFIWLLDKCSDLKYLAKIAAFLSTAHEKVTQKVCLSVHGTLQHITLVYQDGHSFLAPFSTFLSKFSNDYIYHHVPKPVLESL